MVSTYLTFDLVNRDIQKSLKQVSSQTTVTNDTKYYQENIGNVTTVDEFLDDYRLYSYAMTAYGLEDMIYAKAFMKQVLESDLADENSFANRLTDDRYKSFAAAFNFSASDSETAVAQSDGQMQELFDTYDQTIAAINDTAEEDTRYFKVMLGPPGYIKNVDEFLRNDQLREYMFTAYGIDGRYYNYTAMRGILTSNPGDPNSYYQTAYGNTLDAYKAAKAEYDELNERSNLNDNVIPNLQNAISTGEEQKTILEENLAEWQDKLDDPDADPEAVQKQIDKLQASLEQNAESLQSNRDELEKQQDRFDELNGKLVPIEETDQRKAELDQVMTGGAQTEYNELTERQNLAKGIPTLQESISLGQEKKADLESQIAAKQAELDDGGDPAVIQPEIDALQAELDKTEELIQKDQDNLEQSQARFDELDARLLPIEQTNSRKSVLATIINNKTSDIQYMEFMKTLMEDFHFNADGTVPADGAVTPEKLQEIVGGYFNKQTSMTHAEAMFNQEYFEAKIGTITDVKQITSDDRLYNYIRTAFDLDEAYIVKSTIEQILTNSGGIVEQYLDTRPQYKELYEAFNFNADGTVAAGEAQTSFQTSQTRSDYMSRWDDKQEEDYDKAVKFYKSDMASIKSLDDLFSSDAVSTLQFALKAVGIDPSEFSTFKLKSALRSDLSDPNSYIYQLKDERLVTLAKLFNFDKDGDIAPPVLAQSNATITNVGKDYILRKTRYLEGDELEAAKKKAEEDAKYYTDTMQRIDSRDEFLADRKLVDILLTSKGIDPATVTDDFLKQAFTSDLDDPASFVNTQDDKRFAQLVGTFNFDSKGDIDRSVAGEAQNGGEVAATLDLYVRQLLETQEGEENPGVRLALYFQRMADTITDPYVILGDEALMEFFRVTFQLPTEIGNMDVDQQAKIVEKNLNLEDLADPEKLDKLIQRFTIMYDLENDTGMSAPAVSILSGDSGSAGISADTLWALSQIKMG